MHGWRVARCPMPRRACITAAVYVWHAVGRAGTVTRNTASFYVWDVSARPGTHQRQLLRVTATRLHDACGTSWDAVGLIAGIASAQATLRRFPGCRGSRRGPKLHSVQTNTQAICGQSGPRPVCRQGVERLEREMLISFRVSFHCFWQFSAAFSRVERLERDSLRGLSLK